MFCRNCGKEIDAQAAICVSCGYKNGEGNNYCFHCGEKVDPCAQVCIKCGYSLERKNSDNKNDDGRVGEKSRLTAGLFGIFLGGLGVHDFYLGRKSRAVAHILTSLCCGAGAIWGLIDGIVILCDKKYKDADGNLLR